MASIRESVEDALALSAGFAVDATDGAVGEVDTPLFPADRGAPDYLIVRVGRLQPRYPVVPISLVEAVDPVRRVVRVRGTAREIRSLPEHLPLARGGR